MPDSLVELVREQMKGRTQVEYAAFLGVDQSTISRLLSGDRSMGLTIARALKRRHPELAFQIAAFLLADDMPKAHMPPDHIDGSEVAS